MSAFVIVSVIQGASILIDEFAFHHRRTMPRWERLGHPVDTASVLACLYFLYFFDPTPTTITIYYVLAIASCICITKDEWVHWKYCGPAEMWLHAVLFVTHPVLLFSAMAEWETQKFAFLAVALGVSVFFVYQVVYWNALEPYLRKLKEQRRYKKVDKDELYEYFGE